MPGIQRLSLLIVLGVAACGGAEPEVAPPPETVTPPTADAPAAAGDEEGAAEVDAPGTEHADAEAAAVEAAKTWLSLVDAGEYGKSWEAAAPLFKGAVDEAAWGKQLGPVRGPLGAVKSRELSSAEYATALPGAPDGEYVVIQFATSFENKASAVETVTPMLDAGAWKVSGYYIK
jgi:hypothetical protein